MSEQFARVVRERGPWIHGLLTAHARSLENGSMSTLVEISKNSRRGALIVLDIPGPPRGYATVLEGFSPSLQIYVNESEGPGAVMALLERAFDVADGAPLAVDVNRVSSWLAGVIDERGLRFNVSLVNPDEPEDDKATPEPAPEDDKAMPEPEPEPEGDSSIVAAIAESRYAKMRRPQLEHEAKKRSIFIPKKIDDLRRALFEADGESEPFDA